MQNNLPELRIGSHTTRLPIIQGGMGVGISLAGLASAVANEDCIGVISSVGVGQMHPDFNRQNRKKVTRQALKEEIQKARQKSDGIIGMNIMGALTDYEFQVECAVDAEIDVLFLGAGLPLRFSKNIPPERLRETSTAFVPIVSSARVVNLIFTYWKRKYNRVPDAVVVEGPKAGGHLGFSRNQLNDPGLSLEELLPGVIQAVHPFEQQVGVKIPVIAAGGIFTGSDIHDYLKMGAAGVQMGTRFVATHECDADIRFKEAFVQSRESDIVIIDSPVGLPGRAINNSFLRDVASGHKKPFTCPWKCLRTCQIKEAPYCIGDALYNAKKGDLENGFAFAGVNAHRVEKIISVQELIQSLLDEYRTAVHHSSQAA